MPPSVFEVKQVKNKTVLIQISGIDEETLKPQIRDIHKRHKTSEYSFLIEEIPSLTQKFPDQDLRKTFKPAIVAYGKERRRRLRLYPGVADTLLRVKGAGAKIIGYTESMAFYSNYRVRRLGLDGVIDAIYSPADHDIPTAISPEDIRKYPASHYELGRSEHHHTPKGEHKPEQDILRQIVGDTGASRDQCVYVGDSLFKDVAMAIDAGVEHAWAKYGVAQDRPEYVLLREVTHWTDEDVEREKRIKQRHIEPSVVLESGFEQLLDTYSFAQFEADNVRE